MPTASANGIQIEYDTFGDAGAPPVLLVMGLGAQLTAWAEEFCESLAAHGRHVVRFDNRDVGLSTKCEDGGTPDMAAIFAARQKGETVTAAYTIDDMADDAAGLLSSLGHPAVHIVGASMGGMIAQAFALRHPSRTLTLTSIMSSTGNPDLPGPTPEAQAALLTPAPSDRAGYIEHRVMSARAIGCKPEWFDEAQVRAMAGPTYDRSFYPAGVARQMAAITASGSRREALAAVSAPTLVIHGAIDPLVPLAAGKDTAAAIPGAELLVVDGMGHDLPKPAWPEIIGAIVRHTSRVPVA